MDISYQGTSKPRQFQPRSKDELPFYDELSDFSWIQDFLKIQELKKEITALEKDRKRLEDLPPSRKTFEQRIKESYDKIEDERFQWFEKFLTENLSNEDPLRYYVER
ncbi:MAG: hypothetical protein JSW07_07125, partial [bacterium]